MITIYNKQGTAMVTIPTNGTKRRTLMGENYIKLEFEHIDYFDFALGCYIVYEYESDPLRIEQFDITTTSTPEIYKDGFKYSLTFEAAECHLKRFNIFYDEGKNSEVAFCLYDDIDTFGELITKCANKYISTISWSYGGCNLAIEGVKNISFKGDKLYEALNMVAENFNCEWWTETNCRLDSVTGKLKTDVHIWFGKLSVGSEVDFEVDKAVSSMQRQGGDNANYGTRFFCFGSTRNLTSDYEQSSIKSGISETRLHLPKGTPYIDIKEGLTNEEIIHQTIFFDEIYPKNTDIVTKVEIEKRKVEGSNTQKTFDAYIVTATDTPFVPSDIIEGQTLMMEFTSGQLWGQEFEVQIKYDPKTWKKEDGFDKRFEIKAIQEQGDGEIFFIPNAAIKPAKTDTFILKNVKLAKARIEAAEVELLAEGRKWAMKNCADTDVYNCSMNPVYCTPNDLSFDLGQKIRLVDKRFPNGSRLSRIMGYEKNIENKYVGGYTVGDNTTYSHLGKMEGDIKASQYTERVGVDAGGTHIITKYDNTMPSDNNLFSALKSVITFAKLVGGNIFRGVQQFYDELRSSDFVTGLTGRGFQIKKDEHGKWRQEIDSLTVRDFLEVPELRFNKIDVISGEQWNTIAFGLFDNVDVETKIATVKLLEGELLSSKVGDICRGSFHSLGTNNDKEDDNGFARMSGFETTYFTVVELLPDGKSFRYELQSGTSFHPCKAMKFVTYGSFSDVTRQASGYSTRTYTRYLSDIDTWSINPNKHIVAQFGDIDGLTIGGVTMQGTGSFQKNMYMTGVHIQFTPEQQEKIKGDDAYSVSLSSYQGTIKVNPNNTLPPMILEKNVIAEGGNVTVSGKNVTANELRLTSRIQAFKGKQELYYSTTTVPGGYTVTIAPFGCDAVVMGGVLAITSIIDQQNAYVDLSITCEGEAIFNKRYSIVCISDGVNVATGSMPRNCGKYDSSKTYTYDKDFRDCCYTVNDKNGVITYYQVAEFGARLIDIPPGAENDKNWMIGNKETFTAIDTALIDGADIAGFLFKDEKIISRSGTISGKPSIDINNPNYIPNLTLYGKTGYFEAYNGLFKGNIEASGGKIGGFSIENGMLISKNMTLSDNRLLFNDKYVTYDKVQKREVRIGTAIGSVFDEISNACIYIKNFRESQFNGSNIGLYIDTNDGFNQYADVGRNIAILAKGSVEIQNNFKSTNGQPALKVKGISQLNGQTIINDATFIHGELHLYGNLWLHSTPKDLGGTERSLRVRIDDGLVGRSG